MIEIVNFNPLRYDLEVNSSPPVLYYQTKPTGFTFFDVISKTDKDGDRVPDRDNPQNDIVDELNILSDFKVFNDALVNIKNTIEGLKARKSILKSDIDNEIKSFVLLAKDDEPTCETFDCSTNFRLKKQKLIAEISEAIFSVEGKFNKLKKEKDQNKIKEKIIATENLLTKLKDLSKKIDDKISKDLDDIINEYSKIDALEFSKRKNIFVEDTDQIKFELVGTDKFLNMTIDNQLIAKLDVAKKLKISYSAGGFWASRLFDEDYSKKLTYITKADGTEQKMYSINKINGGKQSYGAMAFINFHTQMPDLPVNFGASLGTGLIFNQDAKLVISPTISLIFGDSQRVILHFGFAFAQVERIDSLYSDDALFADADYVPSKKKFFKSSLMLGLSWNLSKN